MFNKSGLYAGITTVLLMLVLGNMWTFDRLVPTGRIRGDTRAEVISQLRWQVWDLPSPTRTASVLQLVLLVVLVTIFGAVAGANAQPVAAFLGGWAAFLAAAVISGVTYGLVVDERFVVNPGSSGFETVTGLVSWSVPVGIWLGWIVGLAVLLGSLGKDRSETVTGPAPA